MKLVNYLNVCLSFSILFILSIMIPYVCPVFDAWFAYPDLLLLSLMVGMCSLY
jgi:hypothetical protein